MPGVDLGSATSVSWRPGAAGATVILTVVGPTGISTMPAVAEVTGLYSATVATALPGRYLLSWSKSAAPALTYTDVLDVWPADPRFLVSLADVRNDLTMGSGQTADDPELRLYMAAATIVIEDIVGMVLLKTITQDASGGKATVTLWERPETVTSVTANGTVLVVNVDYYINKVAGIIGAGTRANPSSFIPGASNITVTYTTGTQTIQPTIRLAAIMLIGHLWRIGQQGGQAAFQTDDDAMVYTPSGFAVPKRVSELCAATPRLPGMA